MNVATVENALTLSGPPRNVRARVPFSVERASVVPVALNIGAHLTIVRAVLRPLSSSASELRLRLPDQTAPGLYPGEATIDGTARAVVLQIEPHLRVRTQPSQTFVSVPAASSEAFALTIVNGGNVSVDIPKTSEFDLDDADGQERALGRSLRATLKPGEARVERFFEELRETHGGEARVTIRRGAGALAPGESRELACVLQVPVDARAGRSYAGAVEFGAVSHAIVAHILSSSRQPTVRTVP